MAEVKADCGAEMPKLAGVKADCGAEIPKLAGAKADYDAEMLKEASGLKKRERLLLHACCAPCATHCVEELSKYFDVEIFFFNPNIDSEAEHALRLSEVRRFVSESGIISAPVIAPDYDRAEFLDCVRGRESDPEGGARCMKCFALRLDRAAERAKALGFAYFATTLTISPLKNAAAVNAIGEAAGLRRGVKFLHSDFKKRDGFKRSVELSRKYGLYRQNYCGCEFSKRARTARSI